MKYIKYTIISFIVLDVLICLGGIIKYNIDLNSYINQKEPERSINNNPSFSDKTEVYVVGSFHFETDKIKRDDIYHYLDSISPSVILCESDSGTVNRMLKRTDFLNQLMSSFKKGNKVESFVSLKYIKHHPGSKVLPFEWEERDSYHSKHKILTKSGELLNSVIRLHRENILSGDRSSIVDEYLAINKEYQKIGGSAKVYDFNNETTDSIIRNRQLYVYKEIPEIAKERNELAAFKDFIPIHMEYWDKRNKAMAANIINQIKLNPNKKIAVLTGYSHRYYLIDELKKYQAELNFSVK